MPQPMCHAWSIEVGLPTCGPFGHPRALNQRERAVSLANSPTRSNTSEKRPVDELAWPLALGQPISSGRLRPP